MARTFVDGSANRISISNPSSSMFATGADWTMLGFVFITDTDGDDRTLVGKYVGASDRFSIRSDLGAAPRPLHIRVNGARLAYSGTTIQENTWYLVGARHTGSSNLLEAVLLTPSLSVVDIGANTGTNNFAGNSGNVAIGNERDSGTATDEMAGRIAFVAYFNRKLADNEIRMYATDPLRVWALYRADMLFGLPLIGAATEPDWSGNGWSGTPNGSPGVGDGPPVKFSYFTSLPAPISMGATAQEVTPAAVDATGQPQTPAAVGSAQQVTPDTFAATAAANDPSAQSPVSVTADVFAASPTVNDPTLQAVVSVTPLDKAQSSSANDPTLTLTVSVTPAAVDATGQPQMPAASVTAVTVNAETAVATPTANSPALTLGGVSVTPASLTITPSVRVPTLAIGGVSVTPAAATPAAIAEDPSTGARGYAVAARAGAAVVTGVVLAAARAAAGIVGAIREAAKGGAALVLAPPAGPPAGAASLPALAVGSGPGAASLPALQLAVPAGAAVVTTGYQVAAPTGAAVVT